MNKIDMVKGAGELVVSYGVTRIVKNVICATMPAGTGVVTKVCITVGSYVLSNMVVDAAVDHVEQKINGYITEAKKFAEKVKQEQEKEVK